MALRAIDKWLWPYLTRPRSSRTDGVVDVLLCVCDHFEPFHAADRDEASRRVAEWATRFPELSAQFRDSDGRPPAHTFFYPIEQYDEAVLGTLASLCRATHAEVEIHLHHDRDTASGLKQKLEEGKACLLRHGLLSRDEFGAVRFGFIHGDWALDDSHPSGRHCGVRNELDVLREAGCYADFTMPSAPSPTQTRTINSVYYARDTAGPKSHDRGTPLQAGSAAGASEGCLLMVQGPLGLNWRRRKLGVLPRLENGEVSGANPASAERLFLWVDLGVHVLGRPEWVVVKLHTHGGLPRNMAVLLGAGMVEFYRSLPASDRAGNPLRYHFVTARELANVIHAAEAGCVGDPGPYRDFRYRRVALS